MYIYICMHIYDYGVIIENNFEKEKKKHYTI